MIPTNTQQLIEEAVERYRKQFPLSHYSCEDRWYNCPKHPDAFRDKETSKECSCGAEVRYEVELDFLRKELTTIASKSAEQPKLLED